MAESLTGSALVTLLDFHFLFGCVLQSCTGWRFNNFLIGLPMRERSEGRGQTKNSLNQKRWKILDLG